MKVFKITIMLMISFIFAETILSAQTVKRPGNFEEKTLSKEVKMPELELDRNWPSELEILKKGQIDLQEKDIVLTTGSPFKTIDIDVVRNYTEEGRAPHLNAMDVNIDNGFGSMQSENRYFDGFIYPKSSSILPSHIKNAFEVDAPIATDTDESKQYFAFGLALKIEEKGDLELFRSSRNKVGYIVGNEIHKERKEFPLTRVAGPNCNSNTPYEYMYRISNKFTGVKSWAAYSPTIDSQLSEGKAVFWETCRESEPSTSRYGTRLTHIAVLIPSSLVRQDGNFSTLNIRTSNANNSMFSPIFNNKNKFSKDINKIDSKLINPSNFDKKKLAKPLSKIVKSPTYTIALFRSPVMLGVVGDSVAWGQGLTASQKYYKLFQDSLNVPTRASVFAHSGARTNYKNIPSTRPPFTERIYSNDEWAEYKRNNDRLGITHAAQQLGSATDYCQEDRDYSGEIPRGHPSTLCQVAHSAKMLCKVTNPNSQNVTFACSTNEPNDDRVASHERLNSNESVPIDIRARYDYVLVSTCLNDFGAFDVLVDGLDNTEDLNKLRRKTNRLCDLRNGLSEIRGYYPNAAVMFTGYHRFYSDETIRHLCYNEDDLAGNDLTWTALNGVLSIASNELYLQQESALTVANLWEDIVGNATRRFESIGPTLRLIEDGNSPLYTRLSLMRSTERSIRSPNGVARLNDDSNIGGRGAVFHVPNNWNDDDAAFANNAKAFGVDCDLDELSGARLSVFAEILEQLKPEDPFEVYKPRYAACVSYAADKGISPAAFSATSFMCNLASAFHPNPDGARTIANSIINKVRNEQIILGPDAALPANGTSARPTL